MQAEDTENEVPKVPRGRLPRRRRCGTVGAGMAHHDLHPEDADHIERQVPYIDRSGRNEYRVGKADISIKTQSIYCCAIRYIYLSVNSICAAHSIWLCDAEPRLTL